MAADWRKIERSIIDFLRRDGFEFRQNADTFVVTRGSCMMAAAGEACPGLSRREINVTELAREIAESA